MKPLPMPWAILIVIITFGTVARGDLPRIDSKQDTLQAVLDRIHEYAANNAWKQGGFTDEAIEKWLDKLVGMVAKAADFPELKLPVRFSEVKPGDPAAGRQVQNSLLIGRDLDLKDVAVRNSIILADGSVEMSRCDSSVVIARGAVTVHMSSNASVIAAGVYIKLGQYDGTPRNTTNGSLVLSRGWADIGAAYGTLIAAPEGIAVGRTEGAVFVNAPVAAPAANVLGPPRDKTARSIKVPDLPLESLPASSAVSRFTILSIFHGPRRGPGQFPGRMEQVFAPRGIVFRFDDQTHVAEVGQPIVDENGQAVESLRNWRLSCVNSRFALLVGPETNAVIRLSKQ